MAFESNVWQGNVYPPFHTALPSDDYINLYMPSCDMHRGPQRAPIVSSEEGWVECPDTGGTSLSGVPVGEAWILLVFAAIYAFMKYLRNKKKLGLSLLLFLYSGILQATTPSITALNFSTESIAAEDSITITPTISADEESMVVCWEVYYDAACTQKVAGSTFVAKGENVVRFAAPSACGTYYVKTSLHSGSTCHTVPFGSRTKAFHVYPGDANIVLARTHQEAGEQLNLSAIMPENKKVYGALHFDKSTLNDDELSSYQRYNYFISFPFDVRVGDISGFGTVGTDWRILYYDGLGRAQEGYFAERTTNWVMIDDTDSVLHAKEGYLLQLNYNSMTSSNSAIWGYSDHIALYFPAQEGISAIVAENETIPALSEAYRCTIDLSSSLGEEGDRRIKDSYWRCIGTPSFTNYAGNTTEEDPFAWSTEDLPYLYRWVMADNSLEVVSNEEFTFLPTHAYLIQNQHEIVWTNVQKPTPSLMPSAQHDLSPLYEFRINLTADEEPIDHSYIRFSEDSRYTTDFDFGFDLAKEFKNGANLYTLLGYERLAGQCLPAKNEITMLPLGVWIDQKGTYQFSMQENNNGIGIFLIDSIEGTRTNLTTSNYSLPLEEGFTDNRFWLEVSPIPSSSTDYTAPSSNVRSLGRKFLLDGQLIIEYNGFFFDGRGIRL